MAGEPAASTLAEKIDALFRVVRRPNRDQYSHEEVAKACREATGESFSATYLWQLRTGRRDNPTKRHLEALAQFFQVPVAYFFDDEQGRTSRANWNCWAHCATRGAQHGVARRQPLPEGVGTISDMIDVIARRERGERPTPGGG
ncbi:helix-turn-helix domain-containing protein [Streptomyces sp. M19]